MLDVVAAATPLLFPTIELARPLMNVVRSVPDDVNDDNYVEPSVSLAFTLVFGLPANVQTIAVGSV